MFLSNLARSFNSHMSCGPTPKACVYYVINVLYLVEHVQTRI